MKNLVIVYCILLCCSFIRSDRAENVLTRFKTPKGYTQQPVPDESFGDWLQNLPLKPAGTHTRIFNGTIARTDHNTAAVVDLSIGHHDLQQCADVVMRLRGEYLYQQKKYDAISFNFVSGFKCDYVHYANGYRYENGKWVLKADKDYSYKTFLNYMNLVFTYAGTLSLEKELQPVKDFHTLQTGDVFIRGGAPGHCFMVMDVVEDAQHNKQFLLAQSFMPAQNLQVLQDGSPWFSLARANNLPYGELINPIYLRRF
ncbi:DUF4846 domain-containing protein [Mucilaginibacter sp. dw_454]|uniref:DUF4846 domain-containing protein n=1 Tax=Mucilaginibacter sp. dw_454 TaxID=2720079 RepID=UPI001BD2B26D|nr:DUF4846 domain-containing protein [Mucilaginibacter sp. dw_454]